MIEHYSFGCIAIEGQKYTKDVIIYPDGRVEDYWWREQGHVLSGKDIADLIASKPEIIVCGTGMPGLMRPDEDIQALLTRKGIEFIAAPSRKAVDLYNKLHGDKKVGACFHLTC